MVLFKITALVAVLAYGLGVSRRDLQTGAQISLFAFGLLLATLFLRVAKATWIALTVGFLLGASIYWWTDTYNTVVPADRLFEFVRLTIWCSILTAIPVGVEERFVRQ
jgi:hypothetical protein